MEDSLQKIWRRSDVFIVNFEHISHLALVFLSISLKIIIGINTFPKSKNRLAFDIVVLVFLLTHFVPMFHFYIPLQSKSVWFLYDNGLCHERVKAGVYPQCSDQPNIGHYCRFNFTLSPRYRILGPTYIKTRHQINISPMAICNQTADL